MTHTLFSSPWLLYQRLLMALANICFGHLKDPHPTPSWEDRQRCLARLKDALCLSPPQWRRRRAESVLQWKAASSNGQIFLPPHLPPQEDRQRHLVMEPALQDLSGGLSSMVRMLSKFGFGLESPTCECKVLVRKLWWPSPSIICFAYMVKSSGNQLNNANVCLPWKRT